MKLVILVLRPSIFPFRLISQDACKVKLAVHIPKFMEIYISFKSQSVIGGLGRLPLPFYAALIDAKG